MQALCPLCRTLLPYPEEKDGEYTCGCGHIVPFKSGIYLFVDRDDFYEGRFAQTIGATGIKKLLKDMVNLLSIDGNEDRFYRKSTRIIRSALGSAPLEILNIGAGGGHTFLNDLGSVTSVDISLASLVKAKDVSEICYQADCTNLPFPDNSFDLVFTSHVLGHLPLEIKNSAISEMLRVLKPGAFALHSIECEADNIIYRMAKRYGDLYQGAFIDMFGHVGLELPSANKLRFRSAGFIPVCEYSDINKGMIRPIQSYKVFFGDRELRHKEPLFMFLYHASAALSGTPLTQVLTNCLFRLLTPLNRLAGEDGVDSVKLLYRKKVNSDNG